MKLRLFCPSSERNETNCCPGISGMIPIPMTNTYPAACSGFTGDTPSTPATSFETTIYISEIRLVMISVSVIFSEKTTFVFPTSPLPIDPAHSTDELAIRVVLTTAMISICPESTGGDGYAPAKLTPGKALPGKYPKHIF